MKPDGGCIYLVMDAMMVGEGVVVVLFDFSLKSGGGIFCVVLLIRSEERRVGKECVP